jgi:tetratricopeptide (TPR) repeat protein
MNRAGVLMRDKDQDVALKILNSVIEMAPSYTEGWSRRAALYFVKKDFAKSLDDLRHALALDPKHFKAIQGLGMLMQELGDKKAALKAFRHALKVHPNLEELRQAEQELAREVEGQGI